MVPAAAGMGPQGQAERERFENEVRRILQAASRDEVLQCPRNRRVAEHVGVANIIRGVVAASGSSPTVVEMHGARLSVTDPLPAPGTPVEVCIRSEDVRLVWPDRLGERANVLGGLITSEVQRRADYLVRVRPEGPAGDLGPIEVQCSAHLHSMMKLHPGKAVWIALPPEKLHVLEPIGEDR